VRSQNQGGTVAIAADEKGMRDSLPGEGKRKLFIVPGGGCRLFNGGKIGQVSRYEKKQGRVLFSFGGRKEKKARVREGKKSPDLFLP